MFKRLALKNEAGEYELNPEAINHFTGGGGRVSVVLSIYRHATFTYESCMRV
jgi:hypothetical protein